jgi:hypothetical protein
MPGGACFSQVDCGVGLFCSDGLCVDPCYAEHGTIELGEPCGGVTLAGGCRRGLVCGLTSDGARCVEPLPIGAECEQGTCATTAICLWRVIDGRCGSALCAMNDFFVEYGEE